jgi:hypothetical protein
MLTLCWPGSFDRLMMFVFPLEELTQTLRIVLSLVFIDEGVSDLHAGVI